MSLFRSLRLLLLALTLIPVRALAVTEVMVFFDAEDFTSDRANDSIRDLANLCTEEGVRAHFAIVGYLAHEIMRHGREDVRVSLRPHLVGTQSLFHSVHPNILEKSDAADYAFSYWSVYADETLSNAWIAEMSGKRPLCAVPPGVSKSYVAMYAYADLGIPFYCDTVVSDGEDGDIFYANMRQIPYYDRFLLEYMLPDASGEPDYAKALDEMSERRRVILFMHPNTALFCEFWDGLNYNRANQAAFGKWRQPRPRTEADTAEFYARLRRFFHRLKSDDRFELTDLERLAAGEVPRKPIRREEASALLQAMKGGLRCTRRPSRSVADVFQAAVRFLRGEETSEPGKVYGFLERPVGVAVPTRVRADDLRKAAFGLDLSTFIPPSIRVGAVTIGPADFLVAALEVVGTGAEAVTVYPREQLGDLDGFPALRDFHPKGDWILTPEFRDAYASDRLRWQFWTLRYND